MGRPKVIPSAGLNRKRLAAAIATSIVAALVGSGLVALASASGNDGGLPDRFGVPESRIGDRGGYTIHYEDSDGDLMVPNFRRINATFEWLEPGVERDGDGSMVAGNRLHVAADYEWDLNRGKTHAWSDFSIQYVDILTGQVEIREGDHGWWQSEWTLGVGPLVINETVEAHMSGFYFGDFATRCGMIGDLYGGSVPLDQPVMLGGICGPDFHNQTAFTAVGIDALATGSALRLESTNDMANVTLWFRDDIPAPMAMRFSWNGSEQTQVWTMAGFERGTEPLAKTMVVPPDEPVSESTFSDWSWLGPDDRELNHANPFSTVMRKALASPDPNPIQEFMADHPAARVGWLDVTQSHADRETSWTYFVSIGEGDEWGTFYVTVQRPDQATILAQMGLDESSLDRTDYQEMGAFRMGADEAPTSGPTWSTVASRWRDFAPEGDGEKQITDYGFYVSCWECTTPSVELHAGHLIVDGAVDPVQLLTEGHATVAGTGGYVSIDQDGETVRVSAVKWRSAQEISGIGAPPASKTDDAPLIMAGIAWTPPNAAAAAGVGFASLLAGLIYYLWPMIKATPLVSMMTRPAVARALRHPTRARLRQLIEASPGIHYQELGRRSELARGVLDHHLNVLAKAQVIRSSTSQGYSCYFLHATDRHVIAAAPALKAASAKRIMDAVLAEPGITPGELATRYKLAPSTISHHMQRLQAAGLLDATRDGRRILLAPTGVGQEAYRHLAA